MLRHIPSGTFQARLSLLILLALGAISAAAQSPQGRFDQIQISVADRSAMRRATPSVTSPEMVLDRFVVRQDGRDALAILIAAGQRPQLNFADGRALVLPLRLETKVSRDGQTVLQYGDDLMRMHPVRTDLFWIDPKGTVAAQVRNKYSGDARVDLSDDGYTALAAPGFFDNRTETLVDLYDPAGRRLFGTRVRPDGRVPEVRALPKGAGVLLLTASKADPLTAHRLGVLRPTGGLSDIPNRFGIVQKIGIVGGGDFAFVQGTEAYGLLDLKSGRSLWERPGRIRQISPRAAALDPAGRFLFVMTGTSEDRADLTYRWTLSVLSASDGAPLGQTTLPRAYKSTPHPVFLDVSADAVTVLADDDRLVIKLSPQR